MQQESIFYSPMEFWLLTQNKLHNCSQFWRCCPSLLLITSQQPILTNPLQVVCFCWIDTLILTTWFLLSPLSQTLEAMPEAVMWTLQLKMCTCGEKNPNFLTTIIELSNNESQWFILRPKILSTILTSLNLTGSQRPDGESLHSQRTYPPAFIQGERLPTWLVNLSARPASFHWVLNLWVSLLYLPTECFNQITFSSRNQRVPFPPVAARSFSNNTFWFPCMSAHGVQCPPLPSCVTEPLSMSPVKYQM